MYAYVVTSDGEIHDCETEQDYVDLLDSWGDEVVDEFICYDNGQGTLIYEAIQ